MKIDLQKISSPENIATALKTFIESGSADGSENMRRKIMKLVPLFALAPQLADALTKMQAHYTDIGKSNPGWMGKLCLQDYALWNEALLAMDVTIAKLKAAK